jgi:hypothetical protein
VHGSSPPRKRWGTLIQSAIAKTVPWPASDRGFAYKATSARRPNPTCAESTPHNNQINELVEKSALHFG